MVASNKTRIYNLIFVTQITRFLSEDAPISSRQTCVVAATNKKEVMAKLEIIINDLFIYFNCLLKTTNILRYFFSLKFENSLFTDKLFRCIFRNDRKVDEVENDQIKYFVQN